MASINSENLRNLLNDFEAEHNARCDVINTPTGIEIAVRFMTPSKLCHYHRSFAFPLETFRTDPADIVAKALQIALKDRARHDEELERKNRPKPSNPKHLRHYGKY